MVRHKTASTNSLGIILAVSFLLSACADRQRMAEEDDYYSYEATRKRDSLEHAVRMLDPKWNRLFEIDTSCEMWSRLRKYPESYKGEIVEFPRLRVNTVYDDEVVALGCGLAEFDKQIVISGRTYTYEFEREHNRWPELKAKDHIRLRGKFAGIDREGRVNINALDVKNFGFVEE